MADDKLSGKAGLDTTEFKTGITTMNRELRVLESGFRASAASLGDWANDATGLESRIKSLNSQMDIQKQKVAATRAEYERIKKEKGENSRAAQDLEIKLNKEVETLGKMENELKQTNETLDDLRSESEDAADGIEELDEEQKDATRSGENFRGAMDDVKSTIGGIASVALGAVKALAAIAAAVVGIAVSMVALTVGPASDLNETISKTQIVFGDAADAVLAFGEDSASALGLSKNEALSAAATYGNLLRAMGLTEDASADMSIELVKLAGDLASFNNLTPEEVLEKLRAGLTGESEPLKTLGVNMNQARIEAKALELGLIKQGEELTAAAKAQAAYAIIMEDTALAQGDFARTSDGLANQQRIMAANFENLRAKMGSAFLPIVNLLATKLNELFNSDEFNTFFEGLIGWLGEAADQLEPFIKTISLFIRQLLGGTNLFTVFEDGSTILENLFGAFGLGEEPAHKLALQIIDIATAIDNFVQGTLIPFTQQHWPEIKAALIGIGAALAAAGIVAVITSIIAAINPVTLIIAAIVAAVGLLAAAWTGNWGGIRDTVTQIWEGFLKPVLTALWDWLSTNIPAALQTLSAFWLNTLLPAIQNVWAFLNDSVFPLFRAIAAFWDAVFGLALRALAGIFQNVFLPPLQEIYSFLQENIFPIFRDLIKFVEDKFQPVFEDLGNFFNNELVPAFESIGDAIGNVIDWLYTMADTLTNMELPVWMTPGSPTPWEIGLIGINRAMQDLTNKLPVLAKGLQLQPNGMPLGLASSVDQSVSNSVQVIGNVIIRGETPVGSLGAALKGRRY